MPQRMKDDERLLLTAYAAGEPHPAVVSPRREIALCRKWALLGWFDRTTGRLTKRGLTMAAKHSLPIVPVATEEAAEEIDTDIYHEETETSQ